MKNPIPGPGDWTPDPQRAFDQHDPARQPDASMSREEIQALMADPDTDGPTWEMLHEHLLDTFSEAELEPVNFATALAEYLVEAKGIHRNAQGVFVMGLASELTRRLFDEMPPPGPLHEIN